jgi:DNA-binding LytR/AlgR family response regulator
MKNQSMKVLIVEDDHIQAENLKENLIKFGYDLIGPAYDSIKALHLAKTNLPDLVLVDIKLENSPLDGIEIVEHIKRYMDVPVIFLSGNYDNLTREKAKKVNPNYFLTKPFYPHQLDIAIDFALYNFMIQQGQSGIQSNLYFPTSLMPENVFFKNNLKYIKINLRDIAYIKASGNVTEIHLNYKSYVISSSMTDIIDKFNCDYIIKTHRSHAINTYAIHSFTNSHVNIYTKDQIEEIPLSDNYRDDFFNAVRIIKTK